MRIIHVTDTSVYNYDGISTYINELLECAEKKGDELLVLTTVPHDPDKKKTLQHKAQIKTFRHYNAFSSAKFKFGIPFGMEKVIDNFNPDIIWIHTIGPLGLYAATKAKNKYPIVYTKHCFDGEFWCSHMKIQKPFRWLVRLSAYIIENVVVNPADKVIYHFNNHKKIHAHKYSFKFTHLPPPLSFKFLSKPGNRNREKDILTLGFCGRCDPEKGVEDIFKAIDTCHENNNGKPIRLILIGDGKVAYDLKKKYPQIHVTITGFVDNVIPYLDQLDAFVLASRTETTSLASLEAYARGIPIFTRPVGYLGENPDKFDNVYVFETPDQLSYLIRNVFTDSPLYIRKAAFELKPSIITFSELHDAVIADYL